jgi:hypothetical protein
MYSYTAYGLNMQSEICLSAMLEGSSSPDILVRRGKVDLPPESNDRSMWTTRNDIYFRFDNVGSFQISRGSEIVIDTAGNDDRVAALFVVGPAMGALLHQRGLLVLHGSAVVVNGGVIAFLGHCGQGKSTMAAAMVKLGNAAFCDDLVPVSICNGTPTVSPGYPFLKLSQQSGEVLGYDNLDWTPILPEDNRCYIAVQGADPLVSMPLARIYVLAEGDRPEIEFLKPQDAAVELIRYSYGLPWVSRSGMAACHLECCAALVERLAIRRLRRPRRLDLIHAVAELVQSDAGGFREAR